MSSRTGRALSPTILTHRAAWSSAMKRAREGLGWSAQQLAHALGLKSPTNIYRWEDGDRHDHPPPIDLLAVPDFGLAYMQELAREMGAEVTLSPSTPPSAAELAAGHREVTKEAAEAAEASFDAVVSGTPGQLLRAAKELRESAAADLKHAALMEAAAGEQLATIKKARAS